MRATIVAITRATPAIASIWSKLRQLKKIFSAITDARLGKRWEIFFMVSPFLLAARPAWNLPETISRTPVGNYIKLTGNYNNNFLSFLSDSCQSRINFRLSLFERFVKLYKNKLFYIHKIINKKSKTNIIEYFIQYKIIYTE